MWREPPWTAPLDVAAAIDRVPDDAVLSGMFTAAVVAGATAQGVRVPSARERYVGFRKYPMREHAQVLVEAARGMWPELPLRHGLRKLGRATPAALVTSTIGRVVVGSVEGPIEVVRGVARSYSIHAQPGSVEVVPVGPCSVIARLRDVYHFLDSHHVGVFEGALRFANVADPRVRIHALSASDADLLLDWSAG